MQSKCAAVELGERLLARRGTAPPPRPRRRSGRSGASRSRSSSSTTSTERVRAVEELGQLVEHAAEQLGRDRLPSGSRARRPGAGRAREPSSASTYTGRWRVSGWRFRWSSTASPFSCGRSRLTITASGMNSWTSARPASPRSASRQRKPCSCATSTARPARSSRSSVITSATRSPAGRSERSSVSGSGQRGRVGAPPRLRGRQLQRGSAPRPARRGRSAAGRARQVERERGALALGALHPDLAAEQACDLAADRQTEAGAAEAAADRALGLLERLEDQAQLVRRDADPGVGDRERDHALGAGEQLARELHVGRRRPMRQLDRAAAR